MTFQIHQFPCLNDNYGFLIHDSASGETAAIDTPDATRINEELSSKGWKLTAIWNTHHHWDHAGGNLALKDKWNCRIYGPAGEAEKIPGIDIRLSEGDTVSLGDVTAHVIETPGHTLGHIIYHLKDQSVAFVGDTLFAMGCGRVFEGTMAQMWTSLDKVRQLPGETTIYCAHEYTQSNARFALSVDGDNPDLQTRAKAVDAARAEGKPTVPFKLSEDLKSNPFLRADDPALAGHVGMSSDNPAQVFGEIRTRKDNF